ncbi:MAG: N-acetylmuramoyl-L-alanine amidase [Chromatiaceae bacterium]|jgi:N-acetylmuramoyl-L-alanine amidase|nr:N-acetylmuramoyl-L-alanine amidase [Chromatiaceae bacterium]
MTRLIAILLLFLPLTLAAEQIEVSGARIWPAPDQTRLVIDTSAAAAHKIFPLDNPHRLVIDITNARLSGKLPTVSADDGLLLGLRSGAPTDGVLRVVLDLKQPVRSKSFVLAPNEQYGHRLAVDLMPANSPDGSGQPKAPARRPPGQARDLIIAIDAGHGGEDPGAIGPKGTREKDITLAIARKLAARVNKERGMEAVLIRDGDYFVALRQRIVRARKEGADLFVSIHADAFQDDRVRGSSVYTLSPRGATSEAAKWLADRENRADLIGGIDTQGNDDVLAKVLIDMTQNATMEHSAVAAQKILDHLKRVGAVHKPVVQKAGFAVLKAPDIPSMLVETAYISNPEEELRLREKAHQERLAGAILGGIKAYFQTYPVPGTLLAASQPRRHVINRGDTLGDIARLYDVSLNALRDVNRIEGDRIRVGQVLTIPEG